MEDNVKLTITTLPVLRNELKMYKYFDDEIKMIHENYAKGYSLVNDPIEEIESQLVAFGNIKRNPNSKESEEDIIKKYNYNSVPESKEQTYNSLLYQKECLEEEKKKWLNENTINYYSSLGVVMARKEAVEHILSKMDIKDREFIKDLYIEDIAFKKVKEKYKLKNDGDIYRKATNILKKYL